ncbi:hypothetical protein E1193_25045 [Micromonospora sp. KC606]|uniref:hypothetical protein n=1 Tax=Micromonospora sp. KC606 TaxID=2530379 RepID=UPI00104E10BA|nr:hypothetical protein [Micromonospora sp. KC606]TDC75743.1 hypothetical protein E1193_25045 [Micromonospora sp. KC606]
MTGRTTVDVLSLEDFHQRLADRLAQAEAAVRKLNSELQGRTPALGSFADATGSARRYTEIQASFAERVARLRRAVEASRAATQTVMTNYRTTEARNTANAADIAAALDGVDEALTGQEDDRV